MGKTSGIPGVISIVPIRGEHLRYYAKSESCENADYVVDLSSRGGNGECGCDDFLYRCQHNLKKSEGKTVLHGRDRTVCKHIIEAYLYYAVEGLKGEQQPARAKPMKVRNATNDRMLPWE